MKTKRKNGLQKLVQQLYIITVCYQSC